MRNLPHYSRSATASPFVPARTPIQGGVPTRFVPLVRDRTALLATESPWTLVLDGPTRSWWYEERGVQGAPRVDQLRHVLHPAVDAAKLDLLLLTDLASLVEEAADGYEPTLPSGFSDRAIELWEELGRALGADRLLLDAALWTHIGNWDWSRTPDALDVDPWSKEEDILAALDVYVERYRRVVGLTGEEPKAVVGKADFAARVHHLCGLALVALGEIAQVAIDRASTAEEAINIQGLANDLEEDLEQNPHPHLDALRDTIGGDVYEWILPALREVDAIRRGRTKQKRKAKACM